MISHIHHINFLVKDLDQAISRYEVLFGNNAFRIDALKQRAVKTARAKLGDTWFILVQPTDTDSVPAKHLKDYGEGFFLMSLATDDIEQEQKHINNHLEHPFPTPERQGLDNWRVIDCRPEQFFAAQLQLTEEV